MSRTKTDHPGLLPAGFHDTDLGGIRRLCVDGFPEEPREWLFERFSAFLAALDSTGIPYEVWVNGSFSTEKPDPDDVDLLVVVDLEAVSAAELDVTRELSVILDPDEAWARYRCHLFVIGNLETYARDRSYWRGWFGFSPPPAEIPKGIPRIRSGL